MGEAICGNFPGIASLTRATEVTYVTEAGRAAL
jgi:hypothetical protein